MMKQQRLFIVVAAVVVHIALAVKPPNYIEKPKVPDKYPPRYEYNYFVANGNNNAAQGHKETRHGDHTAGNYFVNLPKGESKTAVNYVADEWGFFPITRYMSHGPHHRVSGHFALGQHAVERLNETNLNTNEVLLIAQQQQQQQHQQINTKLFPLGGGNPLPLVYQHAQHTPLMYEYRQQPPALPPHLNYFYHQPQRPQDVIYHQQPIISMAPLQHQPIQQPQQIEIIPQAPPVNLLQVQVDPASTENAATLNQEIAKTRDDQRTQFESPIVVNEDGGNVVEPTVVVQQKPKPIAPQPPSRPQINVQILDQTDSQRQYLVQDNDQDLLGSNPSEQKEAPSRAFLRNFKKLHNHPPTTTTATTPCCRKGKDEDTVAITQRPIPANILAPVHAGVLLTKENLDDCIDGHSKHSKPSVVVEVRKNINVVVTKRPPVYGERIVIDSTPQPPPIFVEKSTIAPTVFTHPIVVEKQQPVFIKSPPEIKVVHQPVVQTVEKPIFIEKIVKQPVEKIVDRPVYIKSPPEIIREPIIVEKAVIKEIKVPIEKTTYVKSPPEVKVVQQPIIKTVEKPIFIENYVRQPVEVEKIVDRPVYIKSPPQIIKEPVIVEKEVVKEIKIPVEKTVYVKSPPVTKIVHQPIVQTVEKPIFIEKIVKQPFEVEKIVERIVDRPVERIVEKPVVHTVEKIVEKPLIQTVEKPVLIEKIVDRPIIQTVEKIVEKPVIQTVEKFIDRPIAVPYAVPYEKHVFHKPDFHVIAKAVPHKHKLFDFDALLRFLTKKEEVKHIYVPAAQPFNKHQLVAYSTIEPIKESAYAFLNHNHDYGRYATSHLTTPVKPVYGVPSLASTTLLKPVTSNVYSSPDPYAPSFTGNQGVATVPQSWLTDSASAQSQTPSVVHRDNYVGPTPSWDDYWANNAVSTKDGVKFRRHVENGRSLRIEYGGFLPKMNPSVEIDENGKPINKEGAAT